MLKKEFRIVNLPWIYDPIKDIKNPRNKKPKGTKN